MVNQSILEASFILGSVFFLIKKKNFFLKEVSLYSPTWPGTCPIDLAGLNLALVPFLASAF